MGSDIQLASAPQCPLPFLPPYSSSESALVPCLSSLYPQPLCFLSVHLVSPPPFLSLPIPLCVLYLIFSLFSFPFALDVNALSHSQDSVTLSLSSAHGLHRFLPPLLPPPPPPPSLYHYALPLSLSHPYPFFSLPLAHSLAPAVILPPPPSLVLRCWERESERERAREREMRRESMCVCVESALSLSCGQMEDGAAATSLLLLCSACHRLKGTLFFTLCLLIHPFSSARAALDL